MTTVLNICLNTIKRFRKMLLCEALSGEQVHGVGLYLPRKANKPLVSQRELNGNYQGHRLCVKSATRPVLGCTWTQCVSAVALCLFTMSTSPQGPAQHFDHAFHEMRALGWGFHHSISSIPLPRSWAHFWSQRQRMAALPSSSAKGLITSKANMSF